MGILDQCESVDHYREKCAANKWNTAARAGNTYEMYPASEEDGNIVRRAAEQIEMMKGVKVVVVHPSADNGFPHTRPRDVICLQPSWIHSELMPTLIHESIHIHQRRNKTAWDAVCAAEGWTPLGATLVPERWRERCRINPDTMMCPFWTWQGNHVPLPMFRESPKHLGDCDVQWWDRRTNSLFHEPPRSFVSRYGRSPPQSEHPYELLAVECARKGFLTDSDVLSYLKSL